MACLSIGNAVETCQTGNRKCTENVECLFVGNAAGGHDVLVNRKYNRKCGLLKSWECYRKNAIYIVAGNVVDVWHVHTIGNYTFWCLKCGISR